MKVYDNIEVVYGGTESSFRVRNTSGNFLEVSDNGIILTNISATPSTQENTFIQYAKDITAGNAAPHFRTENGDVIKLYRNTAVTDAQGLADVLTNLGLLASSTVSGGADGNGIYTGSGSLSGNTTVTMATNNLTFASTGDANLLKFDTTNNRIGIGVGSPGYKLDINGNFRLDQEFVQISSTSNNYFLGNLGIGTSNLNGRRLYVSGFAGSYATFSDGSAVTFELSNTRTQSYQPIWAGSVSGSNGSSGMLVTTGSGSTSATINMRLKNSSHNNLIQVNDAGNISMGLNLAPTTNTLLHIRGIDATSSNFALKVDNSASTPLLYVRNDGNIGIGVSTPTNILSFGNNVDHKIWIENSPGAVVGRSLIISSGSAVGGFNNIAGGNLIIQAGVGTGNASSSILFNNGTTLGNEPTLQTISTKMIILGNGNVGINQLSPLEKLHVVGNTRVDGILKIGDTSTTGYAFPSVTGTTGQILEVDGSGDLIFATASGGPSERTQTTGTSITFTEEEVYNTATTPGTGNISFSQTGAKLGIVQKIYHNDSSVPTFSGVTDIQIMGDGVYFTNEINVIYAEWTENNRVEYWIIQEQ
jgi:hypothetical protein